MMKIIFPVLCLAAAAIVLIVFRLHAFDLPLENDECNYAYTGGRLLAGDRLYVDVWDHQPPGVFVLFAGAIALFGNAPEVFRWMTTLFSLASLVLVFALLRRISGQGAAILGAVLFALASSDPGTAGEGCNREIHMTTLILAGWYFALRSVPHCFSRGGWVAHGFSRGGHESVRNSPAPPLKRWATQLALWWSTSRSGWMILASGCALAVASSIKTIVAVHWVFLAVWIAGRHANACVSTLTLNRTNMATQAWAMPPAVARVRSVATALVLFAAGPLLLWLGMLGYFGATGRLSEFVDAVFLFNISYSGSEDEFLMRFVRFFAPERHPFIFGSALPLWIGAGGATVWLLVEVAVRRKREMSAVLLLVLSSYIAVCLPARFWPHYYYLLIAPVVIALSMALGRLVTWLRDSALATPSALRAASWVLFAVFPIALFATEYRDYLSQPPFGITVNRYNSRDFWGRGQGKNVRRVTESEDRIFVFGNDAEIYYYAKRRCASRFTMITGLQSGYAGADQRRRILMAELEERPPRLIVVLFDEKPFDEWRAFLSKHYGEPIGWDFHDRTGEPIMFVLARKDQVIEPINWNWDGSEVGGWVSGGKQGILTPR